jgi:hypothetical protein
MECRLQVRVVGRKGSGGHGELRCVSAGEPEQCGGLRRRRRGPRGLRSLRRDSDERLLIAMSQCRVVAEIRRGNCCVLVEVNSWL